MSRTEHRRPELVLIDGGELYGPEPLGVASVLAGPAILKVGHVDRRALDALGVQTRVLDARDCVVWPGLIDPHEHLIGGSGENGFSTRTPEVFCVELISAGITTVVGCLGTDTTMKTLPDLLAKVRALEEEGLTSYMHTGGYAVPPATLLAGVRDDVMFIDKVIGLGEVAIADSRATEPTARELARLAVDAHVGGQLSRKAGVTHLHVGPGRARLSIVREMLEHFEVEASWIYPTHVQRSRELLDEAIALTRRGAFVDIDTVDEDLPEWLDTYRARGGDFEKLTVSTDAGGSSPSNLLNQLKACVARGWPIDSVVRLATRNTASVLKLAGKGALAPGCDADMIVLTRGSLELRHVVARGRVLMADGRITGAPEFLRDSNRQLNLYGEKTAAGQAH